MSKLDELLVKLDEMRADCPPKYSMVMSREEYDLLRSAMREREGHKALLKEIASANIIFPSLCANNNKAYEIIDKLAEFKEVK